MSTLAIFIIVSLFMQNRANITENELSIWKELDYTVWIVFVFDYVLRFSLAKDKPHFIRTNIIELISILPFDVVFQGLRAVRIIRLIYMFRVFIYLNRFYKRLNAIITTNDFHHVLWFTFSSIFCGAIAISYIDDIDIGDALWWSFVTSTTVGYGDIAPHSLGGRIVAVCLMLIGIGFLSMLTGTIATFFISNNKASYKNESIQQIISRLDNFSSLSIEDINDIHSVLLALKQNQNIKKKDDI
jgi:voltage-gated potassium channel